MLIRNTGYLSNTSQITGTDGNTPEDQNDACNPSFCSTIEGILFTGWRRSCLKVHCCWSKCLTTTIIRRFIRMLIHETLFHFYASLLFKMWWRIMTLNTEVTAVVQPTATKYLEGRGIRDITVVFKLTSVYIIFLFFVG